MQLKNYILLDAIDALLVLAIQITVQKFGNNRLVKYVHGFVSELIGREIQVVIFTNLRLCTLISKVEELRSCLSFRL